MRYSFIVILNAFGKERAIGEVRGVDEFTPSKDADHLEEMCLPLLQSIAGTEGKITVLGDMLEDGKRHEISIILNAASEEATWCKQIRSFVMSFRNWMVDEFKPV